MVGVGERGEVESCFWCLKKDTQKIIGNQKCKNKKKDGTRTHTKILLALKRGDELDSGSQRIQILRCNLKQGRWAPWSASFFYLGKGDLQRLDLVEILVALQRQG